MYTSVNQLFIKSTPLCPKGEYFSQLSDSLLFPLQGEKRRPKKRSDYLSVTIAVMPGIRCGWGWSVASRWTMPFFSTTGLMAETAASWTSEG